MPTNREDFPFAQIPYILDKAVKEYYLKSMKLVPMIIRAAGEAGDRLVQQNVAFVEALSTEARSMRRSMQSTHQAVANEVRAATVKAYDTQLARSGRAQGYRAGATGNTVGRYAAGVLRDALDSPEVIRATSDGISFPNVAFLDKRAAQWHRLNFGAGEAAGGSPRSFTASFGGLTMAGFGFSDERASSGFQIPKGFWGEGGDFYPLREAPRSAQIWQAKKDTRGIRAWSFLDAGMATLVRLLPEAYSHQYDLMFDQAKNHAKGAFTRIQSEVISLSTGGFAQGEY